MKYIYKSLLAVLFLALMPFQGAIAATGSTNVSFDFPNIIVLHYVSDLSLVFNPALDEGVNQGPVVPGDQPLATTATFDAGLIPAGGTTLPDSVTVTVQNAWAVRGITASGQITVTPTIDNDVASNGTSETTMSNIQVQTVSVAAGTAIDVDAPGFVLANAVLGDVVFDLDVSTVTVADVHTGAQYTITATATP